MRPAPRGYSSARLHDLKFTFTPAGADDFVHSKAPLPRGGCLRSAQTGRVFEPILFFLLPRKKRTVLIFQEKKEGRAKPELQTVPPSRQKKPAAFRFRRGGENSISAAFFFLPKL